MNRIILDSGLQKSNETDEPALISSSDGAREEWLNGFLAFTNGIYRMKSLAPLPRLAQDILLVGFHSRGFTCPLLIHLRTSLSITERSLKSVLIIIPLLWVIAAETKQAWWHPMLWRHRIRSV